MLVQTLQEADTKEKILFQDMPVRKNEKGPGRSLGDVHERKNETQRQETGRIHIRKCDSANGNAMLNSEIILK